MRAPFRRRPADAFKPCGQSAIEPRGQSATESCGSASDRTEAEVPGTFEATGDATCCAEGCVYCTGECAAEFGSATEGGAEIDSVRFLDEAGEPLDGLLGGEVVELEIKGRVHRAVSDPIVGFYVQDRLGQTLFADNTAMGSMGQARPMR